MKNVWGKTRKVDNPYLTLHVGDWCWKILKAYQSTKGEADNKYARWFCAVSSPATFGSYDLGDVYIKDVVYAAAQGNLMEELIKAITKRAKEEIAAP